MTGKLACAALLTLSIAGCSSLLPLQPSSQVQPTQPPVAEIQPDAEPQQVAVNPLPEAEPEPLTLLQRLVAEFTWPDESHNPKVEAWIRRYREDPESFLIILERAEPFLFAARQELSENNLPAELAFLPFVESGFQTNVRSWTGAEGLWQFMPATASHMGLERDWWIDERRNPQRSTEAAVAYLKYLHNLFDDWYLALAAYNAGEGNIRYALQRSGSERFWDLQLNSETASYLPKLLAVVHLLRHPDELKLKLPDWPDQPYYREVKIDRQVDLDVVADYLGADKHFYQLNAHFVQRISHPDIHGSLLVPAGLEQKLSDGLSNTSLIPEVSWQHYRVRSGDNLSLIADRLNVSVRAIMETNQIRSSLIHPGDDLLIPKLAGSAAATQGPAESTSLQIMVLPGDSIWRISARTGVSMAEIMQLNELSTSSVLQPGQRLDLPQSASLPDQVEHLVRSGDSLSEIALRYGVTIQQIRTWNALGSSNLIRAGDRLKLWLDGASS